MVRTWPRHWLPQVVVLNVSVTLTDLHKSLYERRVPQRHLLVPLSLTWRSCNFIISVKKSQNLNLLARSCFRNIAKRCTKTSQFPPEQPLCLLLNDDRQRLRVSHPLVYTVRGRIWSKCSSAIYTNFIVSNVQCDSSLVLRVQSGVCFLFKQATTSFLLALT